MKRHYVPPKQGMLGQIVDTATVLVLVYASLMLPLLFKAAAKAENAVVQAAVAVQATWESLGQNAVQQEQWIRLGYSPEKAAVLINNRFDYTIDPVMLGITFAVIIGYFIFLLKVSDKQYREVIAEKFDHE
jgi:hypothetical protein